MGDTSGEFNGQEDKTTIDSSEFIIEAQRQIEQVRRQGYIGCFLDDVGSDPTSILEATLVEERYENLLKKYSGIDEDTLYEQAQSDVSAAHEAATDKMLQPFLENS